MCRRKIFFSSRIRRTGEGVPQCPLDFYSTSTRERLESCVCVCVCVCVLVWSSRVFRVSLSGARMEIVHIAQRKRRDHGKDPVFEEKDPEILVSVEPKHALLDNYIVLNPISRGIQCAPEMSESDEAATERVVLQQQGMLHLEGGWPKDIDPTDADQKARFCKNKLRSEEFIVGICRATEMADRAVKENNAIDIYEEYFAGSAIDHASEPPSAKTLTVFRDPSDFRRTCSHISWLPTDGSRIATSFCVLQFQQMPENMPIDSYVWDINNPNFPAQVITPPSPLVCLEYNPKDPQLLIGGSYNGLVSYWDTRKPTSMPTETSSIDYSHRDPVYDVKWLSSKSGYEALSVSTDGKALIWDVRKRDPIEELVLEARDGVVPGVLGGISVDYDPNVGGATRFMIGTEQGVVLSCNRRVKNPADRIGANSYAGHHGPVYAVQRNHGNFKYFLTVGDWTARIWSEEVSSGPIITTRYHTSYLTGGCWSPTRPGVFFTTKMDGSLDVWDYIYKQNAPVFTLQVSDSGLHCLKAQNEGKLVAVGSMDGSMSLLELSEGLWTRSNAEKDAIQQMFDREQKRERNLVLNARERAQREKKAKADAGKDTDTHDDDLDEESLNQLTSEFYESIGLESSSGDATSSQ